MALDVEALKCLRGLLTQAEGRKQHRASGTHTNKCEQNGLCGHLIRVATHL